MRSIIRPWPISWSIGSDVPGNGASPYHNVSSEFPKMALLAPKPFSASTTSTQINSSCRFTTPGYASSSTSSKRTPPRNASNAAGSTASTTSYNILIPHLVSCIQYLKAMKPITALFLLILLLILLLSSCSPQRRLNRLLALHPELKTPDTLVLRDTIPIPQIQADTILRISTLHDTITLHKDHLQVKIHRLRDTIYIQSKTLPDTIYKTHHIPIQVIRYVQPDTLDNFINKIPWLIVGLTLIVTLLIYIISKFKRS